MAIKRIQNAYYVVQDMGRAADFYRNVLGLGTKFQDGDKWLQLDAGGSNFSLSSVGEAPAGAVGGTIVFEVDNLADLRGSIAEGGGKILGERDMGSHGSTLTFADPDGNIVQLFQRAAAR